MSKKLKLRNEVVRFGRHVSVVVGGLVASVNSFAASILEADTVTAIADAKTDMATVMTAVLGLCVAALAFRWVKATFFG